MRLLDWICGPCIPTPTPASPDVSKVWVSPTMDGSMVPYARGKDEGQTVSDLPCLNIPPPQTPIPAEIVIDSSLNHDVWDPLNATNPRRVHRV